MSEEQQQSKSVDWQSVRADYESGQFSQSDLERKYSVSRRAIMKHASQETWTKAQEPSPMSQKSNTQEVIHPDMNAAVRAALGFKLRYEEYKTWEEVAAGAGYASRGAARNAVKREAERHVSHDISEIRHEELYRLNQLQKKCYTAATDKENDGWTWAVDRYVALSKRKSELMGLDIQVKSDSPTNQIIIREVPIGLLPEPSV